MIKYIKNFFSIFYKTKNNNPKIEITITKDQIIKEDLNEYYMKELEVILNRKNKVEIHVTKDQKIGEDNNPQPKSIQQVLCDIEDNEQNNSYSKFELPFIKEVFNKRIKYDVHKVYEEEKSFLDLENSDNEEIINKEESIISSLYLNNSYKIKDDYLHKVYEEKSFLDLEITESERSKLSPLYLNNSNNSLLSQNSTYDERWFIEDPINDPIKNCDRWYIEDPDNYNPLKKYDRWFIEGPDNYNPLQKGNYSFLIMSFLHLFVTINKGKKAKVIRIILAFISSLILSDICYLSMAKNLGPLITIVEEPIDNQDDEDKEREEREERKKRRERKRKIKQELERRNNPRSGDPLPNTPLPNTPELGEFNSPRSGEPLPNTPELGKFNSPIREFTESKIYNDETDPFEYDLGKMEKNIEEVRKRQGKYSSFWSIYPDNTTRLNNDMQTKSSLWDSIKNFLKNLICSKNDPDPDPTQSKWF
jgi:hypothetical protein